MRLSWKLKWIIGKGGGVSDIMMTWYQFARKGLHSNTDRQHLL